MTHPASFTFSRHALSEIDRRAVEEYSIPIMVLMENAGRSVAESILAIKPVPAAVLIVAGSGNNGGDGFVAARHLHNAGINVTILLITSRDKLRGPAAEQLNIIEKMKLPIEEGGREEVRDWSVEAAPGDIIIDAIFGTGLSRAIEGNAREAIDAINATKRTVVAVDIPSGIDADSGKVLGVAVAATRTVSFCGLKKGFENARSYVGKVTVADIGAPVELLKELAEHE